MAKQTKKKQIKDNAPDLREAIAALSWGKKMFFGFVGFLVGAAIIARSFYAIADWGEERLGTPRWMNEQEAGKSHQVLEGRDSDIAEQVAGLQLQSYDSELQAVEDRLLELQILREKNPKSKVIKDAIKGNQERQSELEELIKKQIEKDRGRRKGK